MNTSWGSIGGGTNCANIDTALQLVQDPSIPIEERILPAIVVEGFGVASIYGAAGSGLFACGTAVPCAAFVEGAVEIGTAVSADGDPTNEINALTQADLSAVQ